MKKLALLIPALLISTPANSAYIKSPEVEKGEIGVHDIAIFENDSEDAFENEIAFEYGFNDWFGIEIAAISEDHSHEDFEWFAASELSLRFELFEEGEYRPNTGLHLGYEYTDAKGEADEIFIMGLFEKNIGKFENIANIKFTSQVGGAAEGGVEFDLNARSAYEVAEHIQVGLEYFGHFGEIGAGNGWNEQGHLLGPVVMFEPIEHTHASLAVLGGISQDAPESAVKIELGYHF